MAKPIYLDYNGTTPHDPEVIAEMKLFLEEEFGNPSSSHWFGIAPKKALMKARNRVAELLNCRPDEIIFTSGGTESNNHAIIGIAYSEKNTGNHIITAKIEHPAVLEVCRFLETQGFEVTYLDVDETGLVSVSDVEKAIRPETFLITIMHANNEVGTIQPAEEIGALAHDRGIIMHTDAAQSIGKLPTDVQAMNVDLLSVAGHKLYAPKGIGALFIKKGTHLRKFMFGAGQESGLRAGTENVLEIVGLGKACEIARRDLDGNVRRMRETRDMLYQGIGASLDKIKLNGHPEKRLPNTLSLSFHNLEANRILEEIGLDIAASAGAACHSDEIKISHVLEALNVPVDWAKGTLRFTTGRMTTGEEIKRSIEIITDSVKRLYS